MRMDALDLIRHETKQSHAWLDNLVRGVTNEQANWRPPGTANSIAETYAHAVISADVDLNRYFYGRAPMICGAWGERVGLHDLFPDDFANEGDIRWAELCAYGREVAGFMGELVDALTLDELDRSVEMMATKHGKPISLGIWKGIDFFALHGWGHIKMHGGEIACLKGLQRGEGHRPFSGGYG
jgi:hypothetical protein